MSKLPEAHPEVTFGNIGILLVNLGTPHKLTTKSIRTFLREFLSDKRVIDTNPFLWFFILNGIILNLRPKKLLPRYESIWNKEHNESPLHYYTRLQTELLGNKLTQEYYIDNICENSTKRKMFVKFAMTYGEPSIKSKITELKEEGCERLLIVPLFPQYSDTTTAAACDIVFRALRDVIWQPSIRVCPHYADMPLYIHKIKNSIDSHIANLSWTPDVVITSYHSVPERYHHRGDPYQCYCHKTTRLLKEEYAKETNEHISRDNYIQIGFQSKFGYSKWIGPDVIDIVKQNIEKGNKNIAVITPGFSVDCIETLEEIEMELYEEFKEFGGENFTYIPCLNDSDDSIELIYSIIKNNLLGWG